VAFDQQIDLIAHRISNRPHDRQRAPFLSRIEESIGRTEGIELERGVTKPFHARGRLGKEGRVARALIPAIGIYAQARTLLAAQQPPDRRVEAFAQDIPAGDLDRAQGHAAVQKFALVELMPDPLGVQRIFADQEARQLVDLGLARLGAQPAGGLA
jgi:hypothetical protein